MSIFKDIIHLWKSDNLLSQAWEESYQMLTLSREMSIQAIRKFHEHNNLSTLRALKERDFEINAFQKNVRRKVVTHFSIEQDVSNLTSGLVLMNMVVDIERIGDYSKNIVDLAMNYTGSFDVEHTSQDLHEIEIEVETRFDKTLEAIHTQDSEVARTLFLSYKELISEKSDQIVNSIIAGNLTFGSEAKTATVALYARYLKRIGGHLKNITTTLVNPIEAIGYVH
jgi:phosphate uptake regulator